MSDYSELKRLAEAFPADLDWDSNTEPFFNGPSGESLGGGSTGFYSVYGPAFRIEGEDYDYDGPTYVEACNVDFAKFMVSARQGVLDLTADLERNQRMLLAACMDMGAIGNALNADMNSDGEALLEMVVDLKAQNNRMLGWLKDISKTSGDKGAVMGARQLLKEFGE